MLSLAWLATQPTVRRNICVLVFCYSSPEAASGQGRCQSSIANTTDQSLLSPLQMCTVFLVRKGGYNHNDYVYHSNTIILQLQLCIHKGTRTILLHLSDSTDKFAQSQHLFCCWLSILTATSQETHIPVVPASLVACMEPTTCQYMTYRRETEPQLAQSGCPDHAAATFWSS